MAANFMRLSMLIRLVSLAAVVSSASGQFHLGPKSRQPSPTPPPMRKASDLIRRQEALKVNQSLLKQATQDNTRIVVSIPKQRAYLMIGDRSWPTAQSRLAERGTKRRMDISTSWKRTPIIIPVFTATSWTVPAA